MVKDVHNGRVVVVGVGAVGVKMLVLLSCGLFLPALMAVEQRLIVGSRQIDEVDVRLRL
jgi:hypothetical protein